MTTNIRLTRCAAAALAAGLILIACESSERVAPENAVITVSANPATIPLSGGPECLSLLGVSDCGTSVITATVRSELGVPLPGQTVRFQSNQGRLFTGNVSNPTDAADLPIDTDGSGNARVNLITAKLTEVTATSGTAADSRNVDTVPGDLGQILINLDTVTCPGTTSTITSCSQEVCVVAEAVDTSGDPIQGLALIFEVQNNTSGENTFDVTFTQASQVSTDAMGEARTRFTPSSTCTAECGGSKPCTAQIVARTQGGVQSVPLQLNINIP